MPPSSGGGHDVQESKPSAASGIDTGGDGRIRKIFGDAAPASSSASLDKTPATRATGIPSFRGRVSLSTDRRRSGLESPPPAQAAVSMPPPAPATARAPSRSIERRNRQSTDGEVDALRARATEAAR